MRDVARWLEGLKKYAQIFADNEIDFEVLSELTVRGTGTVYLIVDKVLVHRSCPQYKVPSSQIRLKVKAKISTLLISYSVDHLDSHFLPAPN